MTVFVLLPAFNEQDAVRVLIPKIHRAVPTAGDAVRVVLVNDGSTDETADRIRELQRDYPVEVVEHPINRGLGETIRDGIEYCVRHGSAGDVIVRMDCDDTHDPAYIPDLVRKLNQGYDVAITSRFQPGGGATGLHGIRRVLSLGAGWFMKLMFPIPGVRDYSSGYRAYRWEILREAVAIFGDRFIEQRHLGFSCTLEKVVKLRLLGARFAEVPHVLRYDQKTSVSKMAGGPTIRGYLLLAVRLSPWCGLARRRWRRHIAQYRNHAATSRQPTAEVEACVASPAT